MSEKRICPRCGNPYSYIERKYVYHRAYYYAVHYHRKGKKRIKKRCYLGPRYYPHETTTHETTTMGLILVPREPFDEMRIVKRMIELIDELESHASEIPPETARRLIPRLERLIRLLSERCDT